MSCRDRRRSNRALRGGPARVDWPDAESPCCFRPSRGPRLDFLLGLFITDHSAGDIRLKLLPHLADNSHAVAVHRRQMGRPELRTLTLSLAGEFFSHPNL